MFTQDTVSFVISQIPRIWPPYARRCGPIANASDSAIAVFATENEWVVFTNDNDLLEQTASFGLIVYSQIDDLQPSTIVDAATTIEQAYDSNADIIETVPGHWV